MWHPLAPGTGFWCTPGSIPVSILESSNSSRLSNCQTGKIGRPLCQFLILQSHWTPAGISGALIRPLSFQCFWIISSSLFWFPTIQNAFSEHFSKYGLDFHSMFVVDLLHEFELGVWKATFTHFLQILYAQGADGIQTLNKWLVLIFSIIDMVNSFLRYQDVPTFGHDTIHKFVHNASGMKKSAARDFEDLLQVHYANHHLCLRY